MYSNIILQDQSFTAYMRKIEKFPILSEEEEKELIRCWIDYGAVWAAHELVTSHLRLVVKIASQFRNYGFAIMDLISEGTLGLMKAVKNFNPEAGCRVATYAMWWIKSAIQEYVLRSWSLVKIGTTSAQRKLFFNLRRMQKKSLSSEQIAQELSVEESEVNEMDQILSGSSCSLDGEDNFMSDLVVKSGNQGLEYEESYSAAYKKKLLLKALNSLNKRYREILVARKLQDKPAKLSILSKKYNISSERVRQIENQAFKKLRSFIMEKYSEFAY